jgi:2-polyprenyl-3-methyl-5-hydroxy-6-metoxy-1,4-benzoquinol methylase
VEQLNDFYESGEYQAICMGGLDDQTHFDLEHRAGTLVFLEVLTRLGVPVEGLRVLEIGCGSGGILLGLKEHGAIVRGYDIDPERIAAGRQRLPELRVGDALSDEVPVQDEDVVLASNVLEHLGDPRRFLKRLYQRMGAGSRLIIDVPNLEGAHLYGERFTDFCHIGHLWYFTSHALGTMIREAGFGVEAVFNRGPAMTIVGRKMAPSAPAAGCAGYDLTRAVIEFALLRSDPDRRGRSRRRSCEGSTPFSRAEVVVASDRESGGRVLGLRSGRRARGAGCSRSRG